MGLTTHPALGSQLPEWPGPRQHQPPVSQPERPAGASATVLVEDGGGGEEPPAIPGKPAPWWPLPIPRPVGDVPDLRPIDAALGWAFTNQALNLTQHPVPTLECDPALPLHLTQHRVHPCPQEAHAQEIVPMGAIGPPSSPPHSPTPTPRLLSLLTSPMPLPHCSCRSAQCQPLDKGSVCGGVSLQI